MTLHLRNADQSQPMPDGTYRGSITLLADITDPEVWNAVVQKLDGMRIYTVSNLSESMIEVSQRAAHAAEKALEQNQLESASELEHLRAALSLAEADKRRFEVANRQLTTQLKAFEAANQKWEAWSQTVDSAPPQGKIGT